MIGKAVQKVAGGKLLKISIEFDDVIDDVKIMGDFFLHPEEAINDIEKNLFGLKTETDEKVIASIIKDVIEEKNFQLIGVTPDAIAQTIKKAIENGVY